MNCYFVIQMRHLHCSHGSRSSVFSQCFNSSVSIKSVHATLQSWHDGGDTTHPHQPNLQSLNNKTKTLIKVSVKFMRDSKPLGTNKPTNIETLRLIPEAVNDLNLILFILKTLTWTGSRLISNHSRLKAVRCHEKLRFYLKKQASSTKSIHQSAIATRYEKTGHATSGLYLRGDTRFLVSQ